MAGNKPQIISGELNNSQHLPNNFVGSRCLGAGHAQFMISGKHITTKTRFFVDHLARIEELVARSTKTISICDITQSPHSSLIPDAKKLP